MKSSEPAICLYFQVHQPYRLGRFNYFDVGKDRGYFDREKNSAILQRVAGKCYRPATAMLLRLLERHPDRFGVCFSLSGTVAEQLGGDAPDVLESFRRLADTGRAEFLSETYSHSLSWIGSRGDFDEEVAEHRRLISRLFGLEPRVFRNTELIYSDSLAKEVEALGFEGILADGVEPLLGTRRPDFVYSCAGSRGLKLLLRNYRLSDDIAFRFGDRGWSEWPLTAPKYVSWLAATGAGGDVVNLFMDFETFGEHQWRETGVFEFFEEMVELAVGRGFRFVTPSEAFSRFPARESLSAPRDVSWADEDRDLSAWQGNDLQRDALRALYALEAPVKASGLLPLRSDWRRLTTSDHFYYMSTKYFADGDVHKYFNPYESPYEAYISYMHVLADLERRLGGAG